MKIIVHAERGMEDKGNAPMYPAPGIADGEHECELVWQSFAPGRGEKGEWFTLPRSEQRKYKRYERTRQIYEVCLSPLKQQGEMSGVKTADVTSIIFNAFIHCLLVSGAHTIGSLKQKDEETMTGVFKYWLENLPDYELTIKQSVINNINISDFIK